YGLSRVSSPSRAEAQTPPRAQRLFHLPAVLGLAALARQSHPPPLCGSALHLSFRGALFSRPRRQRKIYRPSARRRSLPRAHARAIRRKARPGPAASRRRASSREPLGRNFAPPARDARSRSLAR